MDFSALLSQLPAAETLSIRLDPSLVCERFAEGAGRLSRERPDALAVVRQKHTVARVTGPAERLDLVERLLGEARVGDLESVVLPVDGLAFERLASERAVLVASLLSE